MKRISGLLPFLAAVLFFPAGAFAQKAADFYYSHDNSYIANPRYDHLARQALSRPEDFNWMHLRKYYVQTRQYAPLGEEIQLKLLAYFNAAQAAQDPQEIEKAVAGFQLLALDHLANVDALSMAYSLCKKDRRLGDPDFYQWAIRGLMKNVTKTGTGRTIDESFNVVTMGEEALLFKILDLDYLGLEHTLNPSIYAFNVHKVRDPRTGETYKLFVNITIPMAFLEKRMRESKKEKFIPRKQ